MSITISKFSSTQAPTVSSRGNLDTGDVISPYSFQDWVKRNIGLLPTQYITDYNKYLQNWYKINNTIKSSSSSIQTLKNAYKNFLRQVSVSYNSKEEERLFKDVNFDDDFELANVVPLISRKLKAITAYYASKRESAKPTKLKYNMTGTNKAVERILYQYILRSFTKYPYNYTVSDQSITNSLSALSSICDNFEIQVEELYDESNYFDSTSAVGISEYGDYESGVRLLPFSDLTTETLKILYETKFYDETIRETLISDLDYLFGVISSGNTINNATSPGYDESKTYPLTSFVDYTSGSQINSYYEPLLASKYLGSDYYAISADSGGNVVLYGKYLEANTPYAHLSNRVYPTVAAAPYENTIVSVDDIGGYHTPSHLGVLTYATVSPEVSFSSDEMAGNQVYLVPDPNTYTSIRGNSLSSTNSPVIHTCTYEWLKQNHTNSLSNGSIKSGVNLPTFKSYQSRYESIRHDTNGISRVDDNYQFWSGDTASTWSRQDIYPLNWRGEFNISNRTDVLDISGKQLTNWNTDIYGNNYGLYKDIKDSNGNYISIYDKRHNICGELWIRTPYDVILPASTALSAVYTKYTNSPTIYNELTSSDIYSIDVVYDVLVIELGNSVIFEKISFDHSSGEFITTNTTSKIFDTSDSSVMYGGFWFHEKENRLTVNMCISSSYGGIPYLYPELYRIDLNDFSMEKIYSGKNDTTLLLPTTATFVDIDAPILSYNNNTDIFNMSVLCKDADKKCYITSIDVSDRI